MARSAHALPDASDRITTGKEAGSPGTEGSPAPALELKPLPLFAALRDTWRERRLFLSLASQVVTLREPRSILGIWWFPIIILFNTVGMTFIFGKVLSVGTGSDVPYFLFASVGTVAWWLFYRGSIFSMRSFHRLRHSVTVFSVPLILVPLAGVTMTSIFLGFSLILLFGAFPVFWILDGELYLNLAPSLLLFPVALLWIAVLAAIIGLWTGPVFWRARDVRQLFRIVLPFLMFVTPILYPLSKLEATVGSVAGYNPLAPPVEMLRAATFGTSGPAASSIAVSAGLTMALFIGGCWFTNHFGYRFLEWKVEDDDDDEM